MPTVQLRDRAVIRVAGEDALPFLQNLITTDLDKVEAGQAWPGALLSPQGKILFDFLVSRDDPDLLLECRDDIAFDFLRRLLLYRLRTKVRIETLDQSVVSVSWHVESAGSTDDPAASQIDSGASPFASTSPARLDLRFPFPVQRRSFLMPANAGPEAWTALRIDNGVAESGADYALGDTFPHDVSLDQNGGVGFRKGCYVGQEVVSRMQHRGSARRRVMIASADAALPTSGTEISAGGRPLGTLGSVLRTRGLAVVRIDRVKDALDAGAPIQAGEIPVTMSIPPNARYTLPESSPAVEEA